MEARIFVTFVNQYEIDGGTKGTSCHYFFVDDKGEITGGASTASGSAGQQCAKVSLPYDSRKDFITVPGYYTGSFEMTTGSDRKPVLKLVAVRDFVAVDMGFHKVNK